MGEELEQATMQDLKGRRVAVLMTDGVEQVEYTEPRKYLEQLGVQVTLVSPKRAGEDVQGFNHDQPGDKFKVEMSVSEARPADFDALLLPGGERNPAELRKNAEAIRFIKEFGDEDKPIAAICHGPWALIEAGIAESKHLSSWPEIQDDLRKAGAEWTDEEVVVDGKLITSRKPDDIPAFNNALMKELMVIQQAGTDPGPTS
ncbi:type 1 glutamine amidotransferase domain-containing protein [Massilia sp. ZL223]|uniref:type 1 glutamine amidotransferase domain-containing protein n=1 Tax=Massilia sp. ZL223 TaxID=2824904 RepID=UPI001E590E6F|nr:type 1 glutamine amidotransferase domain-containing protein [Massilia sp. ZL223]